MIGWVSGDLTQPLVDRLLTWRHTCWRWYLRVPLQALHRRPEVLRVIASAEVWLWSNDPPTVDEAILAEHLKLDGWIWDSAEFLQWSPAALRALHYPATMPLRAYVDFGPGIPDTWLQQMTAEGVCVVPFWSRPPEGVLPELDAPEVDCPDGLRAAVDEGSLATCGGVCCLSVYPQNVVGCHWSGSAGTVAQSKVEALPVLEGDVSRCRGCLTPFPYWDQEHRRGGPS